MQHRAAAHHAEAAERKKTRAKAYSDAVSRAGREIGLPPDVTDPERRDACERDFRRFCETYFPDIFNRGWSPDHLEAITRIEQSVLEGGLFALAMPRGSGKTSLCEAACAWALLYGHRHFVCIVGADADASDQILASISSELEQNGHLAEDFPEVTYPIALLEGIVNRAKGQLLGGERTHIKMSAHELILPTIQGSAASGGIIRTRGITGRIRGMAFTRPDGQKVRPDLVIVDDPQTDESAESETQCQTRERVLGGAILGLAGPGRKIAGVMPCTVIRPGDLADRLLNRSKHPEWNGFRTRMLHSLPENDELWDEYAQVLRSGLENGLGREPANAFYRDRRQALEEGAEASWESRYEPDELSAIQHAMNIKILRPEAFWSEYQNDPRRQEAHEDQLTLADLKANGRERGLAPESTERITAFIDIQQHLLYWLVCGWTPGFGGAVLDWGTFPEQPVRYFQRSNAGVTLAHVYRDLDFEERLYEALDHVTRLMVPRRYAVHGGGEAFCARLAIDANWHASTDVVYRFCHQGPFPDKLTPYHGRGIGPAGRPLNEYKRRRGDRVGLHWRIPAERTGRPVRHLLFDGNWWKSFVLQRLRAGLGSRSSLSFNGAEIDQLTADHMLSEYFTPTEGRGRRVDEWKLRPSRLDNDWWDCLVGCAVAASQEGITMEQHAQDTRARAHRKRVRLPGRR